MNTHSSIAKAPRPRVADKRTAILRAALEVFAEGGVNGVPMPVVAQRAGVGTGTVYRYFASKDALVNELFREQKIALNRRLYRDFDSSLPPRDQFAVVWQRMIDFAREAPDSFRFMELQDHRPYLDAESRKLERDLFEPALAHYREMQDAGIYRRDIRPGVLLALVWGAYVNLIRAERDGFVTLSQADIDSSRDATWNLCTA